MKYLEEHWGLNGKRVIVTGSSKGIGKEIAITLAGLGAEVCVHYYLGKDDALKVVDKIINAGGQAFALGGDFTKPDQVDTFMIEIKKHWKDSFDILINNAGSLIGRSKIENLDNCLLDSIVKTNFYSTVYCTRAAIPLLNKSEAPVIVNISSIAAHNGGGDGSIIYASMKGALITFTRGLARELGAHFRVNSVAPAAVPTGFLLNNISQQRLDNIARQVPLGRIGSVEDTAAAVVFLCGAGASYITGETIDVSGGRKYAF